MQSGPSTLDTSLVPPTDLLIDGTSSTEEFIAFGEGFCREFLIKRAGLVPSSSILDVGCGNGSVARALTQVLTTEGRYEGLDIHGTSIEWLQGHYTAYPNFRFTHADVYNKMYNPSGRSESSAYRLPYPDAAFDIVLLKSVFTHMLPDDVRAYLQECGRVLRSSGRAVVTYFLLNDESARFSRDKPKLHIDVAWEGDALCRVALVDMPEQAVAHDETRIRGYYRDAGLSVSEMAFGDWCGRPTLIGLQDVIVATKE